LIGVATDQRDGLDIVRRVSLAGRGGVTATAFLDDVCGEVASEFDFDSVKALRYYPESEEVLQVAVDGRASPDLAYPQPIGSVALLAEALDNGSLVVQLVGNVTSAFALPLISGRRCLGFLAGMRGTAGLRAELDEDMLATVGVIAATLLENALVRDDIQHHDVSKSEFIALAVHELRNPLSSIYGIAVTLSDREDRLTEAQSRTLRSALVEQATRMRHLAEQLLDISRFDLDAIRIAPEPVRLRPKIEELVRPLEDVLPGGVAIAVPDDLEVAVDPAALDRMLSNLIANSLRHGKPPVTVSAEQRDTHLRLVVEDRGEGVPREFVPRLFHRFARSEPVGTGDGSGLGLTIAQAYARAHGGKIVYEQADPHGARFEVVLPLRHRNE
jgi:two-component system sensor histidine kinase MtrB